MFRKSQTSSVPDLFSNIESHFKARKQNQMNDENGWHNVFYGHITTKVDESRVCQELCVNDLFFFTINEPDLQT